MAESIFKTTFKNYIKAGFSHYYVRSEEMNLAVEELQDIVKEENFKPIVWSYAVAGPDEEEDSENKINSQDPMSPLSFDYGKDRAALILKNYQWFLWDNSKQGPNPDIVQYVIDRFELFRTKERRTLLIVVGRESKSSALPKDIDREFIEIGFDLPNDEEIATILDRIIDIAKVKKSDFKVKTETRQRLIEAARGMTRSEIENSLARSLVVKKELDPLLIVEQRAKFLEGIPGIKYIKYNETFNDLRGYDRLKGFVLKTIKSILAKGIILLGPPGTGKSHFGKALSGETGMPMFTIELAALQAGIVGETEENVRKLIQAICALAPCLIFIDEPKLVYVKSL